MFFFLQKILLGEKEPLHYRQVFIYNSKSSKPQWTKHVLLLKNKILYISKDVSVIHF